MKFDDGRWVKDESFKFHKLFKEIVRLAISKDTNLTGEYLDEIIDAPFNDKWAQCEAGDGGMVLNEEFLGAIVYNYFKIIDTYKPTEKEKKLAMIAGKFTLAMYRNDSAYFERIGGTVQYIINNKEQFLKIKNVDSEHSALLVSIFNWWRMNDRRLRSRIWISQIFKLLIKFYRTNQFYRRSVNMALIFIASNTDKWTHNTEYDPVNWFPRKRGKLANAIYGWKF